MAVAGNVLQKKKKTRVLTFALAVFGYQVSKTIKRKAVDLILRYCSGFYQRHPNINSFSANHNNS